MAARKAVRYLTVGETTYAPGDEIPADVVGVIDHPDAWVDPDADDEDEPKAAAKRSGK